MTSDSGVGRAPGPVRAFISAGEKSGDLHAANLIRAARRLRPELSFEGFGGSEMAAAGCHLHADIIHLAGMGISFLSNIAAFFRLIRSFHRLLNESPPDVVVLVDFPGFNFILARMAKWREIPVVYYICPQIWAWAPWRRQKILNLTDLLLVILPFEEEFYRSSESQVVYVGHPLADELADVPPAETLEVELRRRFAVPEDCDVVGLFPGSREHEVRELLPVFRRTIDHMALDPTRHRVVVSCCRDEFQEAARRVFEGAGVPVDIHDGDAYQLMAACHLALVASGTATLELAFFRKPMVVFYRVGRLAHFVYRIICTSPFVSLVNILGRGEVVPEEVTWWDNSAAQAERARRLIEDSPERHTCVQKLQQLRDQVFAPGASHRAAAALDRFLANALGV